MCSIQDGDLDVLVPRTKLCDGKTSKTCMKCSKQPAVVVIRVGDPFCRDCFLHYAVHKFRSAFGKNRVVGYKEKVLLAFSGGACSSAMLHLVLESSSERAHKKLGFDTGLAFIDEGIVSGQTLSERTAFREEVISMMRKANIPFYMSSLASPVDVSSPNVNGFSEKSLDSSLSQLKISDDKDKVFLERLNSLKGLTAKEEYVHLLRRQLLLDIARKNGYTKIMLGNCCTRLAADILANISQGRGAHVALDTGFVDARVSDVMFIRPMRDFTTKEVAIYNLLNNIHCAVAPSLTTKMPVNASINRLTENFVTGLHNEFPDAISKITRTGGKMHSAGVEDTRIKDSKQHNDSRSSPENSEGMCPYCLAPLDTNVTESSALFATKFSLTMSRHGMSNSPGSGANCSVDNVECCGQGDGSCHSSDTQLSKEDIMSSVCYGCQLLLRDMEDPVRTVPDFVLKNVGWRLRRSQMRDQISEFLLPDDDS